MVSDVLVAATTEAQDDVLDGYYQAAPSFSADLVVRITSDCPLIDPEIVGNVAGGFLDHQSRLDYAANTLASRNFPCGLNAEVMRFDALERARYLDKNSMWRNHDSPYWFKLNSGIEQKEVL